MTTTDAFWRRCSNCKREIGFSTRYWTCSVSTCNRKGSSFVFCAVDCWQSHVPTMRHRDAWAEEQRSPSREQWGGHSPAAAAPARTSAASPPAAAGGESVRAAGHAGPAGPEAPTPRRIIVDQTASDAPLSNDVPREILIVASKLKSYVKARSGLNTSDTVMSALSDRVRRLCDDAIARAREEGRKTLMDRDF